MSSEQLAEAATLREHESYWSYGKAYILGTVALEGDASNRFTAFRLKMGTGKNNQVTKFFNDAIIDYEAFYDTNPDFASHLSVEEFRVFAESAVEVRRMISTLASRIGNCKDQITAIRKNLETKEIPNFPDSYNRINQFIPTVLEICEDKILAAKVEQASNIIADMQKYSFQTSPQAQCEHIDDALTILQSVLIELKTSEQYRYEGLVTEFQQLS